MTTNDALLADIDFMRRALDLARRAEGAVEPNPMVGAVVVQDGIVVGEGWHQRFGGPHAEVNALVSAGSRAAGGTLYVTLEPCCHFGKTPPCTERVLESGVKRVVCGMSDPFPKVAGGGIELLRQSGVHVDVGCLEAEARILNAPYLKLIHRQRPYVHAKWAMSLDGKIATRIGRSKWITGPAARAHAHRLRGRVDAIVVGSQTVREDDPLLTARPPGERTATRVVLDSLAKTERSCRVVETSREVPTLLATTDQADAGRLAELRDAGCECLVLPASADGRVPLGELLDEMGRRKWTNILVEGGAETLGAFWDQGEVDAVHVYIAPLVIGGSQARSAVGNRGIAELAEALRLTFAPPVDVGGDLYVHGCRPPTDGGSD
jgi:diaminohydroxyphosphoribosylaminopyrimidine deaminase/5-amino-6-(5-phosphoribosylamino)uracil reductase